MNLASRYNAIPSISLGTKIFLHLRWWLTPYARMAAYVPKTAKVLDVGCGHGLLAMELALSEPGRTVLATDHDVARIALAKQAADSGKGIANLQFDVSSGSPVVDGTFDAIMMIDFLHYFSPQQQDEMIAKAYAQLPAGGLFLAREVNQQGGLISKQPLDSPNPTPCKPKKISALKVNPAGKPSSPNTDSKSAQNLAAARYLRIFCIFARSLKAFTLSLKL